MNQITFTIEKATHQQKLHLSLLGSPEILNDGEQIPFTSSRKALALLIYIVVEGKTQSRKKLAELLWPESDTIHARATLRITLVELRKILQDVLGDVPVLLADRDNLSINPSVQITLDLQTVRTSLQMIKDMSHIHQIASEELRIQLLTYLHMSTKLYRGSFMDGFSLRDSSTFDDWVRYQRDYWHQSMHTIFEHLVQLYERAGQLKQAIEVVSRWLSLDPLNEAAYQLLMRLYFAVGNRIAALQTFDTYSTVLKEEMHTEPSPEMIGLKERIRATIPPASKPPVRRILQPPAHSTPPDHLPFVGRANEFNTLIESFYQTQSGKLQVLTLEGPSGMGKTRLATEFLHWAEAQDADILQGQAFAGSNSFPYQPLIDALRVRIERENAPDDLLADVWLAELSRLLPELRERYPDLSLPTNEDAVNRVQMFEAVARLCHKLSLHRTLILYLDDLHWANIDLLKGLYYLIQRWQQSDSAILLLLAFQDEHKTTSNLSLRWRTNLQRLIPHTIRLHLQPLIDTDITYLLKLLLLGDDHIVSLAQPDSSTAHIFSLIEQLSSRLLRLTGGHTLYVIETLKSLLSHQVFLNVPHFLNKQNNIETLLQRIFPAGIYEHLQNRLTLLSPAAHTFVSAVALLEPGAPFMQLCQAADLTESDALLALDELLSIGILCENTNPYGVNSYIFPYARTRELICSTLGETHREVIRARVNRIT